VIAERYERKSTIVTSNLLCGAPHNRFNAELIVMRGPLFAGSDNPLFGAILTPHKRDVA